MSNTPNRPNPAQWLIAISLAAIALTLLIRTDNPILPEADAQVTRSGGARGIFAFSTQFCENSNGICMVDVDTMTLWCYEYVCGTKKLRLLGNRSWMYDRYLENFNIDGPTPQEVQRLVDQEREAKLRNR